jgi:tripartite motif-containing protein 71
VATDAEGFILVADSGNHRVQVFRPDGQYVTHFGTAAQFKGLEGLAVTSTGDVVVCDKENHRVQIL